MEDAPTESEPLIANEHQYIIRFRQSKRKSLVFVRCRHRAVQTLVDAFVPVSAATSCQSQAQGGQRNQKQPAFWFSKHGIPHEKDHDAQRKEPAILDGRLFS
jgi:hypothetical protein